MNSAKTPPDTTATTIWCEMERKDVPMPNFIWEYSAGRPDGTDKEHFKFCSSWCLLSWLIDDEAVLKMKARRSAMPREVRHPHGISRLIKETAKEIGDDVRVLVLGTYDERFNISEEIRPIVLNDLSQKEAKAVLSKEEYEALVSIDA